MRTSNPVLRRQFANPYAGQHQHTPSMGGGQPERPMTLDDVLVKSAVGLGLVVVSAALWWVFAPTLSAPVYLVGWGASALVSVALTIVAAVKRTVPAPLVMLFAVAQGVLVGALSEVFEVRYPGIVMQAVLGTFAAAIVTLAAYKIFNIRVTARFRKIVFLSTAAFAGLMLVNFIVSFFVSGGLGLRSGGAIGLLFAAVGVVLGVLNLVMDFDMIERGIQSGAPASQAWRAALGVTLTVVWLYVEILRLLGALRR